MSSPEVRELIVDTATKYFSKFGYHKTTMDEIAKHIHKAKGLLYYYFKNKEALFNEVLKKELDTVKDKLNEISHHNDNVFDIIEKYLLLRFKLLSSAVNYHETLRADFFEKYHFVKDVRNSFFEFEKSQIEQILIKGTNEGIIEMSSIEKGVNLIMLLLSSLEVPLFLQGKYEEYETTIHELIEFIIQGLKKASIKN